MKEIFIYLRDYFREINPRVGLCTSLIVAILITINYTTGIEPAIKNFDSPVVRILSFFLLYSFIFSISYAICFIFSDKSILKKKQFAFLLLICPLLFAIK